MNRGKVLLPGLFPSCPRIKILYFQERVDAIFHHDNTRDPLPLRTDVNNVLIAARVLLSRFDRKVA